MEAKLAGSAQTPFYDDFEPFCNWHREEGRDTLVLHLPEFKKEQLKIQINNLGVLKISGERALNASKLRSRFYKEVKVSIECNVDDMHANFVNGLLYVVMPKKISVPPEQNPIPIQPVQTDQNPTGRTSPDDKITKMPTSNKESSLPSENAAAAIGKTGTNSEFQQECSAPRWTSYAKKAIKVGLAVALVCAIGAYILYAYNSSRVGIQLRCVIL